MMTNNEIYRQLLALLRNAGEMILQAHDTDDERNVTAKPGDANFVTVYDVKVQEHLISEIKKMMPQAVFIAEEQENDADLLQNDACFVIDPIDGTTNFMRNYHHSCISLALISHGEPIFGAVYNPYLKELFYAEKGNGAYLNGARIHVANRPMKMAIAAYGTAPYYKKNLGERTFALCYQLYQACADVRRCGAAALDLAYLAAGRNDIFFECLLSPWDYAAGYLLIREAGGVITSMDGAEPDFTKPISIMAASPNLYPQLLSLLADTQQ